MPREAFWLAPQERIKVLAGLSALAGALILTIAAVAVFTAFISPVGGPKAAAGVYAGKVSRLEVGKPVTIHKAEAHIVLQPDGSIIALSWRSTHLGCSVPWRERFRFNGTTGWFRDPCHGSTWDAYGHRVFGPAPRDMDRYPVEIKGDNIYILAHDWYLIRGDMVGLR
ncbi:MAG TPA: ubiquinol-cytochrome c reductase iron-sulfur subunit [Dehalococcoidia bacterium]|jgi:cytochrome b6-f complex iron-sulfur subunit|nr:ubiquinol-cytochrome c reductase iron-sulfur subunit [Dehalococcoidia bacterium]